MSGGGKVAQVCACSSDICRSQGCQIVAAAARNVLNASASQPTPDPLLVQALEALREAREALHFHYVEWDGEPEDAVPLQLARSKCDAILAQAKERGL